MCLILSAFFSSSETAFVALDRYHLDYLIRKGNKKAKAIQGLLSPPDRLLATILVGNTFVNAAAASIATFLFVTLLKNDEAVLYATLTTTFMILLFSEITPKIYAAQQPKKLSFFYIYPLKIFIFLLYPFVKGLTMISNLILKIFGQEKAAFPPPLSEDEIRIILTSRMERSDLPLHQKKMLKSILEIRDLSAKEVMIPRTNVVAIEIKSSFKKIVKTILSSEYSRFPVYQDRLDEVKGIIHAKDIIPYLVRKNKFNIHEILRKPLFVPESARLENILRQMQENNMHLAIVVDEYGSMKGIITLEDILEEIVGEIRDEYDIREEELVREIDKNVYLIQGHTPVKEVNRRLKINIPERGDYTTIAGFILSQIRKIPKENEEILYNGIKISVYKMKGTQIKLVKVKLKEQNDGTS
ncbi:hemolysin family protein [Candidatus Aminicenantes bacterium AC-334-E05]|nr:hemolysin family protein [Candidatus Aminicenantes bacterium AC-334-E05]